MLRQTGLVFRRVLWLQALRRHWLARILELLIVTLCFAQLRNYSRPKVSSDVTEAPQDDSHPGFVPAVTYPALTLAQLVDEATPQSKNRTTVCYGPFELYTDTLMKIAFPGEGTRRSRQELERAAGEGGNHAGDVIDSGLWSDPSTTFEHRVAEAEEGVRGLCSQQTRLRNALLPCVAFHEGVSDVLNYTVYVHADESFSADQLAHQRPKAFAPEKDAGEILDHLFATVARVNFAHLMVQSQRSTVIADVPPLQFEFRRFPHPQLPKDIPNYGGVLGWSLMLGFLVPFCLRVHAMVVENSSGLKELQQLMGLSEAAYWAGHFYSHLFFALLQSIVAMLCMLLLRDGNTGEHAFLDRANPLVVALTFGLFSALFSMHAMLVAAFFTNGSIAVTFALIYWVILSFAVPTAIVENFLPSLAAYLFSPRRNKLLSSMAPAIGTYWVIKILMISEDHTGSAGWDLVTKRVLGLDSICILDVWCIMVASCVGAGVLVAYLSQVLPWATGVPKPLYFPLQYGYWFPSRRDDRTFISPMAEKYAIHFQLPPVDNPAIITITGLTKDYGNLVAVENVDLEVYQGLINVILGHNGAGKTTILNVLTGMCSPTKGSVVVDGYDVVENTAEARRSLSFCQQQNVFFHDLTVREHLTYFAALKGVEQNALPGRVAETLKAVRLEDKADCLPSVLSGGMQKRLSVAIATISKPKVVVLDEPTAGMDPETRHEIWEMFMGLRKTCTLLLTTHDMAEADALGDRIVVMVAGAVQCSGTPGFLKKAFGTGYQLRITRHPDTAFQLYDIMQIIKATVPEAEVRRHTQNEVTIFLNVLDCTGFEKMFTELEAQGPGLGVDKIGVSVSTIQDVFLKINREETVMLTRTVAPAHHDHVKRAGNLTAAKEGGTCLGSLTGLLIKRLLCFIRSLVPFATGWVLPVCVFWALFALEHRLAPPRKRRITHLSVPLYLRAAYPGAAAFAHWDGDENRALAEATFLPQLRSSLSSSSSVDFFEDPAAELLAMGAEDFIAYAQDYALGISLTERILEHAGVNISKTLVEVWHNPYAKLSREIGLAIASTSALRLVSEVRNSSIMTRVVLADLVGLSSVEQRGDSDEQLSEYIKQIFVTLLLRTFLVPLGSALLVATTSLLPTAERASGAKELQLMTGLSGAVYWLAHWLFDLVFYLIAWLVIFFVLSFYEPLLGPTKFSFLVVVVAFSGPGILFCYLVSLFAKTQSGGFTFLVLVYAVGGCLLLFAYFAHKMDTRGRLQPTSALDVIFMLAPPFSSSVGLVKLLRLDKENKECLRLRRQAKRWREGPSELSVMCGPDVVAHFGAVDCCAHANDTSWSPVSALMFNVNGVGYEVLVMLIEAVVFFGLLVYWESGHNCPVNRRGLAPPEVDDARLDDDVRRERQQVARLRKNKRLHERALVVDDLHLRYGSLHAVRGLSFSVKQYECLGLLGVNGAGKTSTFQMLTGLLAPTSGDAYMEDLVLSKDKRKWQSRLGYCMQYGGLIDNLTAFEYLVLFARLRGVPSKDLEDLAESFIYIVGLEEGAHKLSGTYSGGGKRKLSIAAALIGLPRLVLLDEPTAGVDVVAKARIFSSLSRIVTDSGIAVILTSHSMDDCESVCDRIGIMVDGQLQCLGSLQHLKGRFGRAYALVLRLAPSEHKQHEKVQKAILAAFTGITLKDYTQGVFKFHLWQKIPWSEVFARVNSLQKLYAFEYAFVSDCNLEEIFVDFARGCIEPYERRLELSPYKGTSILSTTTAAPTTGMTTTGTTGKTT
ncbi:phospholipid-transporting ATPase ABCA3-like [Haemaphysalis longicornis]